jgi:hypothetical protein
MEPRVVRAHVRTYRGVPLLWFSIICLVLPACTRASVPQSPLVSTPSQVGGITFVSPSPQMLKFCQIGANQLRRPVPCPGLLPAHPLFRDTELCTGRDQQLGGPGCFRDGAFLIQEVFRGPASYSGIPDSDGAPSNVGHLNVWSTPEGTIHAAGLGCEDRGRTVGTAEVDGLPAVWLSCPEDVDPPQDSGHIVIRWSDAGFVYAVSVHTDNPVNRTLALAIAQSVVLVQPESRS